MVLFLYTKKETFTLIKISDNELPNEGQITLKLEMESKLYLNCVWNTLQILKLIKVYISDK